MKQFYPKNAAQTERAPFTFEGYLVTDRLYSTYLEDLSLSESSLDNAGVVLDLGSGFSSFVEEANNRHRDSGTHVFGLDIQYAKMAHTKGSLEAFRDNGGIFTPGYGKLERFNYSDEEKADVYREMYEEVGDTGNYLGGSYDKLPFADDSIDLIIGHNSILNPSRSINNLAGLEELVRVIKPSGEARLTPSYFAWDYEANCVGLAYLEADGVLYHDIESRTYQHTQVLKAFAALERQGARFWLPTRKSNGVLESGPLIIRFDDTPPILNTPVGSQGAHEWYDEHKGVWHRNTYTQGLCSFTIISTSKGYTVMSHV